MYSTNRSRYAYSKHKKCYCFTTSDCRNLCAAVVHISILPADGGLQFACLLQQLMGEYHTEGSPDIASCGAGEFLYCTAVLYNKGNVRLEDVTFNGDANCSLDATQLLLPDASISCSFSKLSTQDDFEAGSISWTVMAVASALGTNKAVVGAKASGSTKLVINPKMALDVVRIAGNDSNAGLITQAGTVVQLLVQGTNKGNVNLKNVTLSVPGLTSPLNCSSGLEVLPPKQHVECTGSFLFTQNTLEAGSRNLTANGAAANLAAGVSSSPVLVQVAAAPQLSLDVQGTNCTKPERLREYTCLASETVLCHLRDVT